MPIQIQNKNFTDLFGNSLSYYQANAGDKQTVEIDFTESISVQSSPTRILNLDAVNNIINCSTFNFLDEGFRVGDIVTFRIYGVGGGLITSWSTAVTFVDANNLDVNAVPSWYDYTIGQTITIFVETRKRESMVLNLNHVQNGGTGSQFSLIDGEVTTFQFDLNQYITGNTFIGTQVGNQSGQFACLAQILDSTNYASGTDVRTYKLTLEIIQSGLYDQNDFNFSGCLKLYVGMNFQSLFGEPYNNLEFIISDDANNGWFNEAFNTGIANATLLQGITEIDYVNPSSGQIIIDSSSPNFGFGCAYVSNDETYFKNRTFDQSTLAMILETRQFSIGVPELSALNEFGAGYTLTIDNVSVLGSVYTIDYTFTPNAQFATFMDGRDPGDRMMYVWAKFGTLNLLLFADEMETQPPVGGLLIPVTNKFLDHSQNVTSTTESIFGFSGNIEDDIGFTGTFLLDKSVQYESLTARIEAFNTVSGETFTLQSVFFDFTSVPFNGIKHLLNLSQPVQTQLPTTSEKRNALCELETAIDTVSQYGIHIYFPFLYRWEYWLQQSNASIDFFPNDQTKNWFPYDSTTDWGIRLHIEAVKNGLAYVFNDDLELKNYDSEPLIDQTLELYIDSSNTLVTAVIENELMRVVAYHTNNDLQPWNQSETWGMITVEPTEQSPRWICSTVVPFDFNPNNPLQPISGTLMNITFPSPNIARMECYFDPTKINLVNGCKFTTKIKGCAGGSYSIDKITTDGIQKITTDGQNKIIS